MEIIKTEVFGFKHAIHGMRLPMNSGEKSDSYECNCWKCVDGVCPYNNSCYELKDIKVLEKYIIGKEDMRLAQSLLRSGSEHAKFMRHIIVSADWNMPRYWWSEGDTYKFIEKNSESTMHRLLNNNREITLDLFEHCDEDKVYLKSVIDRLEEMRKEYKTIQKTTKNKDEMNRLLLRAKRLLPEGFLQCRAITTNYSEIRNMWLQRVKTPHRLKEEWIDVFGSWVDTLPYANELIKYTGE